LGIFTDKRLDARYGEISRSMQDKQCIIIRQLAPNRNSEVAYGRFLNNPRVNPNLMIQSACERTSVASRGRDVLLVQDTSTMGFGLYSSIKSLGETGDGSGRGFFLHPVISVDADTGHCLGLSSAKHYERHHYEVDRTQRRRDRNRERLEEKESYRWYEQIACAVELDQGAKSYTVVADREADIYELFVLLTALGVGFVIRSFQNRRLSDDQGLTIDITLSQHPVQGEYSLVVPATDKRSAHQADLEVKWVGLQIARPRSGTGTKHLPKEQPVTLIEVKEKASSVVGKEKPIHWRLLTSYEIHSLEDAQRIISYYVRRWIIEQVFRVLKKKGLNLFQAQVENAHAVKNLCALCLISAVQVMQLVQARNQAEGLDSIVAFEQGEQAFIQAINSGLEGNTEKLKNPYPPKSMAFAAWVIARLGGWSGYSSQRPPGPITMWNGLKRLKAMIEGQRLINGYFKRE
jgi:hypothetical protein